jgi:ABC-type dipeptide/oligopeptide/nickel transport system ATPase subunit
MDILPNYQPAGPTNVEELYELYGRTNNHLKAEKDFTFPLRLLITGPCGTGKTTLAVFLMIQFADNFDRIIIVCPGFEDQPVFRLLDTLVNPKDVFLNPGTQTFKEIKEDLQIVSEYCKKQGKRPLRTLVFVDDLAGLHVIHGGRFGDFPHFAIGCRHLSTSLIVIAQQPTAVSPAFRDNVNAVICFPSNRQQDLEWLIKEYKGINMTKEEMRALIRKAWIGPGNKNEEGVNQHFLTIISHPRMGNRYFCDFDWSVTPKLQKQ